MAGSSAQTAGHHHHHHHHSHRGSGSARHHSHHSRKMRSSIKSRLFNHQGSGGATSSSTWSALKASAAERKVRVHAGTNNDEQVQRLLASGVVNPNAADEHGRTALHIAAAKGYAAVVSTMLRCGAEPNQKDSLGNTPLHLAACTNHIEVVTLLLRAGTSLETLDNNGRTPMQLAQSKLKLLQTNQGTKERAKVKTEVAQVVEMMREYLSKTFKNAAQSNAYSELLNSFSHRLTLHQTHDDINSDLQNLLNSLGNLSLKKSRTNEKETRSSSADASATTAAAASTSSAATAAALVIKSTFAVREGSHR